MIFEEHVSRLPANRCSFVENSNPRKDGYVFGLPSGKGSLGAGYYRLDSEGADEIILARLELRLRGLTAALAEVTAAEEGLARVDAARGLASCCYSVSGERWRQVRMSVAQIRERPSLESPLWTYPTL